MSNGNLPPAPAKKYLCLPGWVKSAHDPQSHRIPASRLPGLYGVDPRACLFGYGDEQQMRELHPDLIVLRPRSDGKYQLP